MAANHIKADQNKELIRKAVRGLTMVREGAWNINNALAGMIALKDGDGTQASHFDLMATECGVSPADYADANTAAKALFDELNSVDGNLAAGLAAAEQLCGYLGV